jgi:hypothetical protein
MRARQAKKIVREHGRWHPVPFLVNGHDTEAAFFSCGKWDSNVKVRKEIGRFFFGESKVHFVYGYPITGVE